MKRLMALMLGLSLAMGSVAMFAQDTKKAPAKAKKTATKAPKAKKTAAKK